MFYVYFIQSQKDKSVYIGSTGDLRKRFQEHDSGQSTFTKSRRPFRLIYYEAYLDRTTARKRELKLKKSWSEKEAVLNRLGI